MKKITLTLILALLTVFGLNFLKNADEVGKMTDKFLRLHILANSDSREDQELKLKVRDGVLECAAKIISGSDTKEEAEERLSRNLDKIEDAARCVLIGQGSEQKVAVSLGREIFNARDYDDFTLPAGEYDSLMIRLGEANGKNWWCICYPGLCIGASSDIEEAEILTEGELRIVREPERVKYKLWCYETVLKLRDLLGL